MREPGAAKSASPRDAARSLHAQALAAAARGEQDAADELYDRALAADPAFVPAVVDRAMFSEYDRTTHTLFERILADPSSQMRRCVDGVKALLRGASVVPLAERPVTTCDLVHRLGVVHRGLSPDERIALGIAAFTQFPESPYLFRNALIELDLAGRYEALLSLIASDGERSMQHVMASEEYATVSLHRLGRHEEAVEREREVARRQTASLDLVRLMLYGAWGNHTNLYHQSLSPSLRQHLDSAVEIARGRRAWQRMPTTSLRFTGALAVLRQQLDAGQLSEALDLARTLEPLADSIGLLVARSDLAVLHGRAAVKAGKYDLAERKLIVARELGRQARAPRLEWEANHNLLHLYESTGRDSLALLAGLEFARLTSMAPMRSERMMSYRDLGVHLRHRGRWQESQQWFDRMVATVDSLRDGHSDFYAGEYLESVGQLERALTFYNERARAAVPERSLAALARLSELLGDTGQALRYAEEHDTQGRKEYPEVRPLLPGLMARMGRWDVARGLLQSARREAAAREQRASWGRLTTEEAGVALQQGEPEYAMALADSAVAALDGALERDFRVQAVGIGAVAAARIGRPDARGRIATLVRERRQAIATGGAALAADLALHEGDALRALGDRRGALAAYDRGQHVVDSLVAGIADDATRSAVFASLRRVSTRALEVILTRRGDADAAELWRRWSSYRKARTVDLHTRARVVARPSQRAIVDFAVLDSTIGVFVSTPHGSIIRDLHVRPAEIVSLIDRLYATAAPRIGSVVDASRARFDGEAVAALARALIDPVAGDIANWERLEIVPDAFLSMVPFDMLPLGSGLLLERHVLSLAPSLTRAGHHERQREGYALVVAGPARSNHEPPGAPDEARRITNAITHRPVHLLSGRDVGESSVRARMAGAAIIHLAAHARPNVATPDFADVWLAPDSMSDGRLQAFEIREMRLDGATVVLSACETGSGKVAGGEGPMSLARAFVQAGAGHVVATLWPVRANAARLMGTLHAKLDAGEAPARALRDAKLELLRQGERPLDMAPFIILGSRR